MSEYGTNLFAAQQRIAAYAQANIPWEVSTGGVGDAEFKTLVNGELNPYVVLRFSDMMPASGGGSFNGADYDEYYSYVDALCVAKTDVEARELASLVSAKLMGKSFENVSQLRRSFGGGAFVLGSGERLPAAYVAIVSLRYGLNIQSVGENYLT